MTTTERRCHVCLSRPVRGKGKRLCQFCAADGAELKLAKDRCRAYTRKLIERGVIERKPCIICGAEPAEAHHVTYTNPRCVIFFCIPHHRAHERAKRQKMAMRGVLVPIAFIDFPARTVA